MNKFKNVLDRLLPRGGFARNVSILVGGTAFGQAINIAALPILTRIYSPSDFGLFASYMAIVSILATVSCLRFEIAIPIPKSDNVALNISVMGLLFLLVFFGVLLALAFFFEGGRFDLLREHSNYPLYLVPFSVLFLGLYAILQYWASRKSRYSLVAKTRVTQSIAGIGGKLLFGWFNYLTLGLIYGQLVQSLFGIVSLTRCFISDLSKGFEKINKKSLFKAFCDYSRFPKYSVWESLTNVAGIQVPVFLIANNLSSKAGFLMLAMQLLAAPMTLVGRSTAQVYLTQASEKARQNQLYTFSVATSKMLAKIGLLPLLIAGFFAPYAMPYIFGGEWAEAGALIPWMVPWFFMQFVVSPISMSLHIMKMQKVAFLLQLFGLILRVGVVVLAINYALNSVVIFYAMSGFVFYSFYFWVVLRKLKSF